jgi:ribosomal protein S18 acetylase RimI-like enzyme
MIQTLNSDHAALIHDLLKTIGENEFSKSSYWTLDRIREHLLHKKAVGLFLKKELCAFVLFQQLDQNLQEVEYLATGGKFTRQGCMTQLVSYLQSQLKQKGELWLEVHVKNIKAYKLYESLGFFNIGERKNYYSDGGSATLMKWISAS